MKIIFLMDPIEGITPAKDTTFALMLAAQERGDQIFYAKAQDIWCYNAMVWGAIISC